MPDKISILKESGETINSNVVSVFMIPDTEKKYIITTENAVDPHGLTVLHVSEIVDGSLQKIATDEEWSSIKTIMRAMISGNVSSYQYLPTVESINASGQYSRDISVSSSASKQMIDNYAVGEKSNVAPVQASQPNNMGVNPVGVMPPTAPVTPPPSIFPTNGGPTANVEDELIPGISEVDATPVDPSVLQNSPVNNPMNPVAPVPPVSPMVSVAGVQNMPGPIGVPPVMNDNNQAMVSPSNPMISPTPGVMAPSTPIQPAVVSPVAVPNNTQMNPTLGNVNPVVSPIAGTTDLNNNVMNNDVQVAGIPGMPPLTDNVNTMTASNSQVNNGLLTPENNITPEIEVAPLTPLMSPSVNPTPEVAPATEIIPIADVAPVPDAGVIPEVQVLQPTDTVPTAQIAQEAPADVPVPEVKIDSSAAPSFAPDASLSEVVNAAQEMFMEGVKNLVQTIQEKVYRDLYAKEAELKEREKMIEQREKMVSDEMMAMMSNFAAMQGKVMPSATTQAPLIENNENK